MADCAAEGYKKLTFENYDLSRAFVTANRTDRGVDYSVMLPVRRGLLPKTAPGRFLTLAHCLRPEYADLIIKALKKEEANGA